MATFSASFASITQDFHATLNQTLKLIPCPSTLLGFMLLLQLLFVKDEWTARVNLELFIFICPRGRGRWRYKEPSWFVILFATDTNMTYCYNFIYPLCYNFYSCTSRWTFIRNDVLFWSHSNQSNARHKSLIRRYAAKWL